MTWRQFRDALQSAHDLDSDDVDPCIPFVAFKQKHVGYLGFHTIASFSSRIIREYCLDFDRFVVRYGDKVVGYFEAWQEGYSDEDHNDQPLAFGVRFRVSGDFVRTVCKSSGCAFAVQAVENRFAMKEYEQEPAERSSLRSESGQFIAFN